jgi:hypothetical protein
MQLGWLLFMRGGGAVNEGPMACQPSGLYFDLSTSNKSIKKKENKKQLDILIRWRYLCSYAVVTEASLTDISTASWSFMDL